MGGLGDATDPGGRCPVVGCDRGVVSSGFPACRCERWLAWLLVLLVLLVSMLVGGLPNANADVWDDQIEGSCPPGEEYRGYHRVVGRCSSCVNNQGQVAWQSYSSGGRRCVGCAHCGGTYYFACAGDAEWPVPACIDSPLTADEEADAERLGDILAAIGGQAAAGGNPWGLGGGSAVSPLGLFGDGIGAVEADDVVPQVADGDDGYECPAGTTLIESGEYEGQCSVSDRCAFYGAGGTWPDCTCTASPGADDRYSHVGIDWPAGWFWDRYALRCMPRESNAASVLRPAATAGSSYLWDLVCSTDVRAGASRGYVSAEQYLTQSSPVFTVRRGGVEVARYGSLARLTVNLGQADWALSSDEEGDETTFGSVVCSWLRAPMTAVEEAFSGFAIQRTATRCPTLTIPFFNQSVDVTIHCVLIGRWLGLIQAIAVVSYSFLAARFVWGRNTGHVRSFAGQGW